MQRRRSRAGRCEVRGVSPRPPLRLSRPRVEILPSGGGRDEEAPARPGLCAPHAPRSLSAAQGRSIAAPRPRRRGGSGTAACIGAITVSARPRWRPEDVRGSGTGSGAGAGPGSPGRPRPARGEAPPPRRPPGEKAAVPRSACACPLAGIRPAPALEVTQHLSGIRTLPGVAQRWLPRAPLPEVAAIPTKAIVPMIASSPALPSQTIPTPAARLPSHRPYLHPARSTAAAGPVQSQAVPAPRLAKSLPNPACSLSPLA